MAQKSDRGLLRRRQGAAAEALAAGYLTAQGLEVLARNVRCKGGELDLLCRDGEVLVVVEVRQRSRHDYGGALASVTWRKRRRIIRATRFLLATAPQWRRHLLRFDVIGLQGAPDRAPELEWVKDAFRTA
ncbi:MAG: YraN family protein [Steroidobacteraceae bacterium]